MKVPSGHPPGLQPEFRTTGRHSEELLKETSVAVWVGVGVPGSR